MFKSKSEIDMCSGPITSKLLYYTIPLILSGILQLLFNAADMAVVGQFGTNGERSLAAVGATNSLVNLIVHAFIGLSTGVNAVVARRYGAGDKQCVRKAVHTSVFLGIASGIIVIIIGLSLTKILLGLMSAPEDLIDLSALYLRIYFLGAPFMMFYNFGSAILRAVGDTKRPLYFLTVAGIINVVLNLLFIIVFKLDAAGVAIATVVSQIASAVLVFVTLVKHTGHIRLFQREIRIHSGEFFQIIKIGIPAGIQNCIFSFSNMVVQSSINFFGTQTIAACSASSSIEGFAYIGMGSFYQTVLAFVSQNFGRVNFDRIRKIIIRAVFLVIGIGILSGIVFLELNEFLMGLYLPNDIDNKAEIIQIGLERGKIVISLYFLCGIMEAFVGALRGMGQSFIPMIASIVGVCGGRLVWIMTVFEHFKNTSGIDILGIHFSPLQILMFS